MSDNIVVISKKNCIQCDMTKRRLTAAGQAYTLRMIEDNSTTLVDATGQATVVQTPADEPQALDQVRKLGYSSMPVVVTADAHWAGFQPEKIDGIAVAA